MSSVFRYLIILIALIATPLVTATASSTQSVDIQYLLPISATLSLDDIQTRTDWLTSETGWVKETLFEHNYWYGATPKVAWLKIKFLNAQQPSSPATWLELASSGVTRALMHYQDVHGEWKTINSEAASNSDEQRVRSRFISFRVTDEMNLKEIYLRIESTDKFQLQLNLYDNQSYLNNIIQSNFFFALGYGLMLVMIFYNLVIGVFLKDSLYYIYASVMTCALLYQFFAHGHSRLFIDLNWDWVNYSLNFMVMLTTTLSIYFLYHFSNIKLYSPKVAKVVNIFIKFLFVCTFITLIVSPSIALNIVLLLAGPLPGLALAIGVWAWYCGSREAKFFTVAWLFYICAGLLWLFYWLGLLPLNNWVEMPLIIGAAFESVLLSLALAYRIRILSEQTNQLELSETHYKKLSMLDSLSNLANRRAFDAKLSELNATDKQFGVILLDIDNFKQFNDLYGHIAGDKVIQKLGRILNTSLRENALCARVGGEEFAVLIANEDKDGLLMIAERVRETFSKATYHVNDTTTQCTISLGVASKQLNESTTALITRADKALYEAKKLGRNRVYFADESQLTINT
ncbi:diguanylate cyclase [Aliikangiella sp. IMCC44653]